MEYKIREILILICEMRLISGQYLANLGRGRVTFYKSSQPYTVAEWTALDGLFLLVNAL